MNFQFILFWALYILGVLVCVGVTGWILFRIFSSQVLHRLSKNEVRNGSASGWFLGRQLCAVLFCALGFITIILTRGYFLPYTIPLFVIALGILFDWFWVKLAGLPVVFVSGSWLSLILITASLSPGWYWLVIPNAVGSVGAFLFLLCDIVTLNRRRQIGA